MHHSLRQATGDGRLPGEELPRRPSRKEKEWGRAQFIGTSEAHRCITMAQADRLRQASVRRTLSVSSG